MKKLKIYTDGGCSGNPGKGAWAYVVLENDQVIKEAADGAEYTTNNKMELSAVINALKDCEALYGVDFEAEIYTDSQYVKNGITSWIHNWLKNGWKTASKQPVKNADLWRELKSLDDRFSPKWNWVKGHAGNEFNERCDSLLKTYF
ncbi:MAG: ribonuclease HI [Spirochaetales bacterium]|nr:ribonuclease HI [Spirochaetales bacterium]